VSNPSYQTLSKLVQLQTDSNVQNYNYPVSCGLYEMQDKHSNDQARPIAGLRALIGLVSDPGFISKSGLCIMTLMSLCCALIIHLKFQVTRTRTMSHWPLQGNKTTIVRRSPQGAAVKPTGCLRGEEQIRPTQAQARKKLQ